jgi:hypothetical protein
MKDEVTILGGLEYTNSIIEHSAPIKWTNTNDCPNGYEWNDEGWVQTNEPHLQVKVNTLPYLLSKLGEYNLIFQNTIALRYLNPHPKSIILKVMQRKFMQSYMRYPEEDLLTDAVDAAFEVENIRDVLSWVSKDIFSFQDLWFSVDCTFTGRKQLATILKQRYIESCRSIMPINSKYNTKGVMDFTSTTEYAVKQHWKMTELDANTRTGRAILEAIEQIQIMNPDEKLTQTKIAEVAGLTVRTVRTHLGKLSGIKEPKSLK